MSRASNCLTLVLFVQCLLVARASHAAPINPATLSGRVLHHRADVGVFTNAAGTTAATNGQTVRHWSDQSASNSDALNTVAAGSQPTFVTGVFPISNKPGLQFDGINDYLAQALDLDAGDKTFFLVYASDGLVGDDSIYSLRDSVSNVWSDFNLLSSGGYQPITFSVDFSSTTSRGLAIAGDTDPHVLGITYDGGSITSNASFDARYDQSTPSVVASGALGRVGTDLGAIGARLSAGLTTAIPYDGIIGEIVVFDRELTAVEFAGVQEFLYLKYFAPAVPEPSTGLLSGLGILALAWRAKRRNRPDRIGR